jgi:hypothetical protein
VLRRGCLDCPVERSTEVVEVARDDASPLEVISAPQVRTGRFGQGNVVVGVAASHHRRVPTRLQAFLGILADALEQPVPHRAIRVVINDNEGLVDQLTQHVVHIEDVEVVACEDRLRRRQVTATSEHRQPI